MSASPVRYARNGPVDIAYCDWGHRAGGPAYPMLLVAGLGGGRHAYPPGLVDELVSTGFHVVTYDHRDVGASTRFTDAPAAGNPLTGVLGMGAVAYSVEDMTDDAVAVMDAVGWRAAHLFGLSMGGLVAQRIALRHPERSLSLATMGAMSSDTGRIAGLRYLHLGFIRATSKLDYPDTAEGDVETAVAVGRLCASPAYPFDEPAMQEWLRQVPVDGVRDTAAQARHMRATWHGPRLSTLTLPTLVLHGDDDPVVRPSAARAIAGAVPHAELAILPGIGHELPARVWTDLAGRIRDNASAGDARPPAPKLRN